MTTSEPLIERLFEKMQAWQIRGFIADHEAAGLFVYAKDATQRGPCLEIGSYCGKSTVFLASACAFHRQVVFAVDHHRGSEEHQPGELYHDADLYNDREQCFDSLPEFRRTLARFAIEEHVVPILSRSETLAAVWQQPLSMIFIDGGHSLEQATHDCLAWSKKLTSGGVFAVHDICLTPAEGGQAPYFALQKLLQLEQFYLERKIGSLVILRKKSPLSQ